VQKGV